VQKQRIKDFCAKFALFESHAHLYHIWSSALWFRLLIVDGGDGRGHRRAMAKAMAAAAAVPHFFYVEEIVMDKLTEIKRSLNQEVPLEAGVKLTHLPFLIKSLSMTLKKFPVINSTVAEAVTEIQGRGTTP